MKSILINYSIVREIDKEKIYEILNGCKSDKYKVYLNFYDFSLTKKIQHYVNDISDDKIKISVYERDYEDSKKFIQMITDDIIKYSDSIAYTALNDSVVLNDNCLDSIEFEVFKNGAYGFLYFDYSINGIRCFVKSRLEKLTIPVIFFSLEYTIKNISSDNVIETLLKNSIGLHIPKSLCIIYPDNE
jgi:hypothetical protein